jgi:hypothetical protein
LLGCHQVQTLPFELGQGLASFVTGNRNPCLPRAGLCDLLSPVNHRFESLSAWIVSGWLLLLAGCGRNDVKTYQVAKESPPAQAPAPTLPPGHPEVGSAMPGSPAAGVMSRPQVSWTVPEGWTENAPGAMRVGSFRINGKDGKQADVSVIPLGGAAGGDEANVNRWRGQVGLEPLSAVEIKKLAQSVEVAGQPAELYELSGKNPGSGDPLGVLGAIAQREGTAWFFKMTGDPGVIAEQKPVFVAFLKTVKFEAGETPGLPAGHPPMGGVEAGLPAGHPEVSSPMPLLSTTPGAAISTSGKPGWQVPPGWQEAPGGQFLVAKFNVSDDGGAQAVVNVSASVGDGGGLAGNVNRWRKQIGLPEQSADEVQKSVATVEASGGKATLVEMSGTDARTGQPAKICGAMVSQGGQTWFYKLVGDAKLVEAQKEAFVKFVQGAKY